VVAVARTQTVAVAGEATAALIIEQLAADLQALGGEPVPRGEEVVPGNRQSVRVVAEEAEGSVAGPTEQAPEALPAGLLGRTAGVVVVDH
jgi:hypothetical protein